MIITIFNLANYQFNAHSLPYFISGILLMAESFFIFIQNRKSLLNISFSLAAFFASIWLTGVGFIYSSATELIANIWSRYYSWLGIIFITPAVYLFSEVWKEISLKQKLKFICFNFITAFVFYVLAISSNYFVNGLWAYSWGLYPRAGLVEPIFIIWFYTIMILSFRNFIRSYQNEKIEIRKKQARLIILAFTLGFMGSLDFVANFGIPFYTFAAISVLFFSSTIAYAIIHYKLMDIETVFHKTLLWLAASSVIILPIVFLSYLLSPWYKEATPLKVALLCTAIFYLLLSYLKLIQPNIDHFFQRRKYNLEKASEKFISELIHLKTPVELIKKIQQTIHNTLYAENVSTFIYNEAAKKFLLVNKKSTDQSLELSPDDAFLNWLTKTNIIIYKDFIETDPKYERIKNYAREYFEKIYAVVTIPLILDNNLLGVINLGKKSSLKRYNAYDFQFLLRLKNESTIALSNSLLYGRVEEEVQLRTQELVKTQRQLIHAEKLATVGTLAGGVAHEINNPLTAILTNVQMLLSDADANKLDKESLELIEEATKRCRTIVQKLMTYARKPLETAERSRINLLDVLKSASSFIGYQLEQDNIRIVTDARENAYFVMANYNEMEQVFTNIILNARDAIKHIKKSGVININFSQSGDWIKIEIKDEGAGIPKEISAKIFDPFFTTKDVGKGVGLGLSICQSIVEKHNGLITFESEVGKGSTFTMRFHKSGTKLPKKKAESPTTREHLQKPLIEKLMKKNILLIDDDGIITRTLCDLLKGAGFYAEASPNGYDAIEKTDDAVFDLIIADIKMPGIDGVQTIKKIKESSRSKNRPDVPVLFITGYADSEAADEARKLGEVLIKPFDTKEFLTKVAKYI